MKTNMQRPNPMGFFGQFLKASSLFHFMYEKLSNNLLTDPKPKTVVEKYSCQSMKEITITCSNHTSKSKIRVVVRRLISV